MQQEKMRGAKIKNRKRKEGLEHYCYLRYCKAITREAQLFWIRMHLKTGAAERGYTWKLA